MQGYKYLFWFLALRKREKEMTQRYVVVSAGGKR